VNWDRYSLERRIRIQGSALRDGIKYHQGAIQTVLEKITKDGRDLTIEQMGDLEWIDPGATIDLASATATKTP
jgi:hypothetical protein